MLVRTCSRTASRRAFSAAAWAAKIGMDAWIDQPGRVARPFGVRLHPARVVEQVHGGDDLGPFAADLAVGAADVAGGDGLQLPAQDVAGDPAGMGLAGTPALPISVWKRKVLGTTIRMMKLHAFSTVAALSARIVIGSGALARVLGLGQLDAVEQERQPGQQPAPL